MLYLFVSKEYVDTKKIKTWLVLNIIHWQGWFWLFEQCRWTRWTLSIESLWSESFCGSFLCLVTMGLWICSSMRNIVPKSSRRSARLKFLDAAETCCVPCAHEHWRNPEAAKFVEFLHSFLPANPCGGSYPQTRVEVIFRAALKPFSLLGCGLWSGGLLALSGGQ